MISSKLTWLREILLKELQFVTPLENNETGIRVQLSTTNSVKDFPAKIVKIGNKKL